jgi:hypothetical protein
VPAIDELNAASGHALLTHVRPAGDEARIIGMTRRARNAASSAFSVASLKW